ncbi:hypothetical protein F1C16_16770 [Hymenobacter sp. NBH84]|uniref:hypothetical protein n=1 Tax=Hymenobacter sp. NBH84 TaxID=2596915 RepID=UPI001628F8DF|nr:hypothetical protein [Hymenobacter sp. NBH84]QNE41101.1 hypothetical protein F1C16_16770 [Hymenobacter sp. NBH84]
MRKNIYVLAVLLLVSVSTHTAAAQTVRPAKSRAAARDTTVEGIYVAPNMTGAPKQQVTTDYSNNPISPAVEEKGNSLSPNPDPVKSKKLKTRRPPKRD